MSLIFSSGLQNVPFRYCNRTEHALDLTSTLFQPGRQHQVMSKLGYWLIYGKAWPGSRQFYDMPVGIVGIDAFEVDALHNRRDAQASLHQFLTPDELRLFVGNSEGIMVCLSGTHTHTRSFTVITLKVSYQRAGMSISNAPVPVSRVGVVKIGGHFDAPHAEQISKERMCTLNIAADGGDMMQSMAQGHITGDVVYSLNVDCRGHECFSPLALPDVIFHIIAYRRHYCVIGRT